MMVCCSTVRTRRVVVVVARRCNPDLLVCWDANLFLALDKMQWLKEKWSASRFACIIVVVARMSYLCFEVAGTRTYCFTVVLAFSWRSIKYSVRTRNGRFHVDLVFRTLSNGNRTENTGPLLLSRNRTCTLLHFSTSNTPNFVVQS